MGDTVWLAVKIIKQPMTLGHVLLQAHQVSLPITFPLVLPKAGALWPFEAAAPPTALSFTSLLTILWGGI